MDFNWLEISQVKPHSFRLQRLPLQVFTRSMVPQRRVMCGFIKPFEIEIDNESSS